MNANDQHGLGELCEELFEANFQIYSLENKKWWGRKDGTASSAEIDEWDRGSRIWNEKRSTLKMGIDAAIAASLPRAVPDRTVGRNASSALNPFAVVPISLMIDMLAIERIKAHDLLQKKDADGVKRAEAKILELKKLIDASIEKVSAERRYDAAAEARTF